MYLFVCDWFGGKAFDNIRSKRREAARVLQEVQKNLKLPAVRMLFYTLSFVIGLTYNG